MAGHSVRSRGRQESDPATLVALVRDACEPLPPLDDPDAFAAAFDRFADARVVLLGEATHGTSEFYRARAAITRRLVKRHGYTIVAVEADWPDAGRIDRYVRDRAPAPASAEEAEAAFARFPAWMWRNEEVLDFVQWLRAWNVARPAEARAEFRSLDVYSLRGSIASQFDAFVWFEETTAVAALPAGHRRPGDAPETYLFGL